MPRSKRKSSHQPAGSTGADEAVEHFLPARMLEIHLQLVAFDRSDGAVAELAVEHALAEREVGASLVAEAHCGGARFDDPGRLRIVADATRALPAGPAS